MNRRQQALLNYIHEHKEATNQELLSISGDISNMTLWRDLTMLEKEGHIVRFRGGAAAVGDPSGGGGQEINFLRRARQNTGEKEEIAQIAADLISPDRSYFLDAGSTTYTLVSYLQRGNYNITTSAVNIAAKLAEHPAYDVTILGGQMNANTLSSSGPQAERMLAEINIDCAIMATSGLTSNGGFTSGRMSEAEIKKRVIDKAAFVMMLVDHDKFQRRHPFTFATIEDVDIVIGDRALPEEFRTMCQVRGIPCFTPDDGRDPLERVQMVKNLYQSSLDRSS